MSIFYYYDFYEMPVFKKNQQARCFYALSSKSCAIKSHQDFTCNKKTRSETVLDNVKST